MTLYVYANPHNTKGVIITPSSASSVFFGGGGWPHNIATLNSDCKSTIRLSYDLMQLLSTRESLLIISKKRKGINLQWNTKRCRPSSKRYCAQNKDNNIFCFRTPNVSFKYFCSLLQLTKLEGATTNFRDTYEAQRLSAFQGYANLVTPNIQRVVEFAKRVPGNMNQVIVVLARTFGWVKLWLPNRLQLARV